MRIGSGRRLLGLLVLAVGIVSLVLGVAGLVGEGGSVTAPYVVLAVTCFGTAAVLLTTTGGQPPGR